MKRYSIRRPGNTSWADTDTIRAARKLCAEANRICQPGHVIVDNRSGELVPPDC